jgi:ATP-binding cassette subfamily B multidrug efflux pump
MTASYYEDELTLGSILDRRIIRRLGSYLLPYRWPVAVAVLMMIGVAALELIPVLILREAIDGQIANPEGARTDQLGQLAIAFVAALAGIFVLRYVQAYLMAWVGQRVMMDLRMDLFRHLQRMSVAFFDRNPVGRLVTRLNNDINQLEQMISQGVVQMLTNLLMVTGIIVVLFVLNWQLALIMYAFLVPLVYLIRRFANEQRNAFRDERIWIARLNAYLNELITGVAVVQLFNRQRRNLEHFDERNQGVLAANMRIIFWYAVFEPTVVMFGAITTGMILWYGGAQVIDEALTIGTLIAFINYMQRFFWPIRDLSERYTLLQAAMASGERIIGVLDEPEELTDPEHPIELEEIEGRIEFDRVWFAYNAENWVLRDVTFTLDPGEKVAIVGATGAGKSTMMALLSRFYDVQRGEIRVDGIPLGRFRQRELRRHVGIMLQDPFILTDSVAENIRLRDPSISREQLERAAEAVGASVFIERLSDGYDTLLAERGANLSTGQKQLIALARVAAFDPEIVLVMDEATASIDPETESTIQRGLERVMSGRTSIVIAHRLNTIRAVDRIIVLHLGELVEEGTHDQLVATGGYYTRLYELQYRDQDPATA